MVVSGKNTLPWKLADIALVLLIGSCCVYAQDTLYSASDPVVQLTTSNFSANVLGSRVAWAVEFYSTWCGHCQRFAPVWVQFAESIKGWDSVIRVAAIACSDPRNAPTCRHHNIWGYPTIKFYPKNASQFHKGNPYNGNSAPEELRKAVLDYVIASRDSPRIHLQSIRSLDEAESLRRPATYATFLIAVPKTREGRYTAQTALLDLSSLYPEVVVVWSTPDILKPHGVTDYPSVYRFTNSGLQRIQSKGEMVSIITRESLRTSTTASSSTTSVSTTRPTAISSTSSPGPTPPYIPPDGLHTQDLDSAVYYSLWVEVAARKELSRAALKALKSHVSVLADYFPGSHHVKRFLRKVRRWLKFVKTPVTGKDWVGNITSLQNRNAFVPQKAVWTGCKGTSRKFRGYPCGLWMTYHALTVNAYLTGHRNQTRRTLQAMAGYIEHFFGCRHCANHFATMATSIDRDVSTNKDGVLWLWTVHNKVNNRLHGDETEDPNHPKIQFPSPKICSECRLSAGGKYNPIVKWDDIRVLAYLVAFYRKENVIEDSAKSKYEPTKAISEKKGCILNSTSWSSCTKTCGTGVSSRVSNANQQCEMRLEFRLCQIRPCNVQIKNHNGSAQSCENDRYSTVQSARKTRLAYRNCYSVDRFTWRYCGTCKNKCCQPASERTASINIKCRENEKWFVTKANVMKINHCTCGETC